MLQKASYGLHSRLYWFKSSRLFGNMDHLTGQESWSFSGDYIMVHREVHRSFTRVAENLQKLTLAKLLLLLRFLPFPSLACFSAFESVTFSAKMWLANNSVYMSKNSHNWQEFVFKKREEKKIFPTFVSHCCKIRFHRYDRWCSQPICRIAFDTGQPDAGWGKAAAAEIEPA